MTFALAARCPRTGMLGAAVATSSLAVGSRCVFARAGIGAILTQHRTDPRLGPRGLEFLAAGKTAQETIDALVTSTPHHGWRQLAGGENEPVRSAALLVVHEQSFPYVDLRVDDDAAPIERLAALWRAYAPEADDFVTRAIAPDDAPGFREPKP